MRLWLKDDERRPDPKPARIDDRKVALVGTGLWLVALAVMLVLLPQLADSGMLWLLWMTVAGIALGLVVLVYTQVRHSR